MSKVLEVGVTVFGNRMELGTKWVGYLRVGPKWERNPNEDGFILTPNLYIGNPMKCGIRLQ